MVVHASQTMSGILSAVGKLTDTVEEITSASAEQARGVEQVGIAVTEMDSTTQQNASLVEESASAAANLNVQAERLLQAVSVFSLGHEDGPSAVVYQSTAAVKTEWQTATVNNVHENAGDKGWTHF